MPTKNLLAVVEAETVDGLTHKSASTTSLPQRCSDAEFASTSTATLPPLTQKLCVNGGKKVLPDFGLVQKVTKKVWENYCQA